MIDELEAKFENGVEREEFLKVEDMNYLSQCYINGKACTKFSLGVCLVVLN